MSRFGQVSFLLCMALSISLLHAQPLTSNSENTAMPAPNGQILTLDQAINIALQNNLALQAASRGVKSSQWGVKKAYLDFLPQLDFDLRYLRIDDGTLDRANAFYNFVQDNQDAFPPELTGNVRPGAYKDAFGPSISIVQPIYNGGILRSQLNFAQALDDRSNANLEDTRQQVIFDTYSTYFDVLARAKCWTSECARATKCSVSKLRSPRPKTR